MNAGNEMAVVSDFVQEVNIRRGISGAEWADAYDHVGSLLTSPKTYNAT